MCPYVKDFQGMYNVKQTWGTLARNEYHLFELHHDVLGQLHILEHALQLTGESRSTFLTLMIGMKLVSDHCIIRNGFV